jgi:hypothetical protein
MSPQSKLIAVFPEGADRKLLQGLQRKALAERKRLFQDEHKKFLEEAEMKAKVLEPITSKLAISRREIESLMSEQRAKMKKLLSGAKPGAIKPLKGDNPVRYAPYDMPWSSISCGGITYCHLYGPKPATGEAGASLGIFNGGGASSVASNGFWYYAQQNGTLYLTIQALVWGRGYVFSGLFGYASAYAGLRAYVERYSSDFTTFKATSNIYDNWGVLEFDIRTFDWVNRSVSLTLPVRRNTWYAIWADMVQSAYAGGIADSVSNFDMYVGPVSYFVV